MKTIGQEENGAPRGLSGGGAYCERTNASVHIPAVVKLSM